MKNCEAIMDEFLMLDKNERIPFRITWHLLCCKKCRTQVRLLTKSERLASEPLKMETPLTSSTITAVMQKINPAYTEEMVSKNPVTLRGWIICGILMIIAMLAFGLYTSRTTNHALLLSSYLVFALMLTAYGSLFIGCNLDFFVKKINSLNLSI